MLTLNDGRNELWQWDTGRKLTVDADCSQVHFSNKVFGRSLDVDVIDGVAAIPDILLQTDKELTAWAFVGTPESGYTKISKVFKVNRRNKPAGYVFTPSDQTTLDDILNRIEDLEKRPSGDVSKEDIQDAVNEYLDNNPVSVDERDPTVPDWAKQPQKPTYTAAEVSALPDTTKIPSTAKDVGALPANAFIPKSATDVGAIPVPETATVGQTIVVRAVDESGKPTEWECADMASGSVGGETWELIADATTTEDVAVFAITTDLNGEAFELKKALVVAYMAGPSESLTPTTGTKITFCKAKANSPWAMAAGAFARGPTGAGDAYIMASIYAESIDGYVYVSDPMESYNVAMRNAVRPSQTGINETWVSNAFVNKKDNMRGIDAVSIGSYKLEITVGTRMLVYGVRA